MEQVFMFPIEDGPAKANFGITVEKGYELETLLPFVRDEIPIDDLRRFYPDGKCYLWGVQERGNNRSLWNVMAQGDLVLGYRSRSIVSASYVLMRIDHPSLADTLWGKNAEGPFRLICFMDHPYLGEVPIVPQLLRYVDPDCRGFTKLHPEKCEHILSDYGSLETFVHLGLGYDFPFSFRHSE
jgi:hypothetical protein